MFARLASPSKKRAVTMEQDEHGEMTALGVFGAAFFRNPERAVLLGGNHVAFGLVAGPPSVHDLVNGRRDANLTDYENFIRLAQYFNAIHIIGNQEAAPLELPANTRHLDTYLANLTLSDLTFHCEPAVSSQAAQIRANRSWGAPLGECFEPENW